MFTGDVQKKVTPEAGVMIFEPGTTRDAGSPQGCPHVGFHFWPQDPRDNSRLWFEAAVCGAPLPQPREMDTRANKTHLGLHLPQGNSARPLVRGASTANSRSRDTLKPVPRPGLSGSPRLRIPTQEGLPPSRLSFHCPSGPVSMTFRKPECTASVKPWQTR